MLHFPHWKIIAALMAMIAGVFFATPTGFSEDAGKKMTIVAELQNKELLNAGALPAPINFISMTSEDP